jgi:hypothetical protein
MACWPPFFSGTLMSTITTATQLTTAIQTLEYQGASIVTVTVNKQAVDWDVHVLLGSNSIINAIVSQAAGSPITVTKKS